MIVVSVRCLDRIYELRKGPKKYIAYLPDGQRVVQAQNNDEAVPIYLDLLMVQVKCILDEKATKDEAHKLDEALCRGDS